MNKLYSLGPDDICEYDIGRLPDNFQWCIYWYEDNPDDYYGSGYMVVKTENGEFVDHNMGHCSCYGPMCEFPYAESGMNQEEMLNDLCGLDNTILHGKGWTGDGQYDVLKKFCRIEGISLTQLKKDRPHVKK